MPSLIIQSDGVVTAGAFAARVLIGRKAFNGVQFGQRAISRIHAWIDQAEEGYYISDARSRAGTTVNGKRITGKATLRDGDVIGIGPEKLIFRSTHVLPAGAISFEIADDGTNPDFPHMGIILQCDCGAPMWAPQSMAGAYGKCMVCQGPITVPGEPLSGIRRPLTPNDSIVDMPAISDLGSEERPEDPLAVDFPRPTPRESQQACGVCQCPILRGETTTSCPSCAQIYHVECWKENYGCASYGCDQVGALDAPLPPRPAEVVLPDPPRRPVTPVAATTIEPKSELVDHSLLVGSIIASVVGVLAFGLPAAIAAGYALWRRGRAAAWPATFGLVGAAAGVFISWAIWFGSPLWVHH